MRNEMLHVFRNTPAGRETLLQSMYFCKKDGDLALSIFVPVHPRFSLKFDTSEIYIFLNKSYLVNGTSAKRHISEILEGSGVKYTYCNPESYASEELPEISTDYKFISCPRVVSEHTGLISLGHIGPKVRSIVKNAISPIFIPSMNYKKWKSVSIFYGGSALAIKAVKVGIKIANKANLPFTIFTQLDASTKFDECKKKLLEHNILEKLDDRNKWIKFETGKFEENLFFVPHDSLAVIGAAGHKLIKELVFGSKLEKVQSLLLNPLLVIGPQCIVTKHLNK